MEVVYLSYLANSAIPSLLDCRISVFCQFIWQKIPYKRFCRVGEKNCPGCWNWRLRVSVFLEMSYAEVQLQQGNCIALLHPWSDLFKVSTLSLLNTGSTSNYYYKTLPMLAIAWVLQYHFQDHCYTTVQLMLLAILITVMVNCVC